MECPSGLKLKTSLKIKIEKGLITTDNQGFIQLLKVYSQIKPQTSIKGILIIF